MRTLAIALLLAASTLDAGTLDAQAPTSAATPSQPASPSPLEGLRWLSGCWELRTPTRVIVEQWMPPSGGLMIGGSRTVVRGVAREFEFLRIEVREGIVHYVAQPNGRAETAFGAAFVSDTAARFENPSHDFPTRIGYRRVGSDSLIARVEGPEGGRLRGFDLPMRRVGCGG